ncbi:MAG: hypothetical protein LBU76_02420, partial [Azoarcus sp.]|nr:hypothetical protein [Azoarcus sp.]
YGGQGFRGRTGSRGGLLGTGLGAGGEHRHAFGQVVWAGPGGGQVRPEAALWSDDRNGRLEVGGVRLSIAGPDAPGDGTVPAQSGAAPDGQPGVEMVFAHGQGHPGRHNLEFGYDHQDACNDERALYATLYAIVKIAQRADWYEAKKETK